MKQNRPSSAFTIVELLVVIVVIGILATVVVVAYNGVSGRAVTASLQADLNGGKKLVEAFYATNGVYPTANNCTNTLTTEVCLKPSSGNTFTYTPSSTSSPSGYALSVLNSSTKQTAATSTSDPYFANVVALLKGDGSNGSTTITDSSPLASIWVIDGTVTTSSTQKKFGIASIYFNGGCLSLSQNSSSLMFGTADFTIEMWAYPTVLNNINTIYDTRPGYTGGAYPRIYIDSNGQIIFARGNDPVISGGSIAVNNWYHISVSRSNGSTRLFINGIQAGTTYADSSNYLSGGSSKPTLANNTYIYNTDKFTGYLDDMRVTNGVARYTSNFTPPGAL